MKSPSLRVLLIDDELDLVDILTLNMSIMGYSCQASANTADAREHLLRERFDFVICDVIMPGESGLEFFEKLKSQSRALPPFIFYSGLSELPFEKPYPDGIIGFIQKPFSMSAFFAQLPEELRPL